MRHGSNIDPPNRFASVNIEWLFDDVAFDEEYLYVHNIDKIQMR